MHHYPLFWVTMIMSNLTEDDKIKGFVQALTLALQNIVAKPSESEIKRKPRKHKKVDQNKPKHIDPKSWSARIYAEEWMSIEAQHHLKDGESPGLFFKELLKQCQDRGRHRLASAWIRETR